MRLVGGWVGRGRAMTRHLRSGFDTMMREAELEEMQKQWAKQNAEIMAATVPATVGPHSYDAAPPHAADAVVGEQVYDHPGALPIAEALPPGHRHSRGDDAMTGTDVAAAMTGPQPAPHALAEPAIPLEPAARP